jgi:hypothetical protein
MATHDRIPRTLSDQAGRTHVDDAGISLRDRPALDHYRGDLHRQRALGDPGRVRTLLEEFPRLGPVALDGVPAERVRAA